MLSGIKTIHKPHTLDEAIHFLTEAQVRPLYGQVALEREAPQDVQAVVDLSALGLDKQRVFDKGFALGSMLSLEAARQHCLTLANEIPNAKFLAEILAQEETPELRQRMTIGDVLVERRADSLLISALVLLDAQISANGWLRFIHKWLDAPAIEVKSALITEVALEQGSPNARYAFEKTATDSPFQMGAMSYIERHEHTLSDARLAIYGLAAYPIPLASVDEELIHTNGNIDAALAKLTLEAPADKTENWAEQLVQATELARRVLERSL